MPDSLPRDQRDGGTSRPRAARTTPSPGSHADSRRGRPEVRPTSRFSAQVAVGRTSV